MHVPSVTDSFEHHAWPEDAPAIDGETLAKLEGRGLVRIVECGTASSIRPDARRYDVGRSVPFRLW